MLASKQNERNENMRVARKPNINCFKKMVGKLQISTKSHTHVKDQNTIFNDSITTSHEYLIGIFIELQIWICQLSSHLPSSKL